MGEALKTGRAWLGTIIRDFFRQSIVSKRVGGMWCTPLGRANPGFEKAQGMAFFDYPAHHPSEDASLFSEMMVGMNKQKAPAVAAAYDFSVFKTIVDVGGASGNMLAAVLSLIMPGRAASCSTGRML